MAKKHKNLDNIPIQWDGDVVGGNSPASNILLEDYTTDLGGILNPSKIQT